MSIQQISRQVDEAVEKQTITAAPQEHARHAPFVDMRNRRGGFEQLVGIALKQLIARIGRQNLCQRLVIETAGDVPGAFEHLGDPQAYDGNRGRLRRVNGRCVKAEKSVLAGDVTGGIEELDADVVRIGWAVDPRHGPRPGKAQVGRLKQKAQRFIAQLRQGAAGRRASQRQMAQFAAALLHHGAIGKGE